MSEVERYVDKAMYPAAPMQAAEPRVHLLHMTADPLGTIAAACRMYKGITTYSLEEITKEEREDYWLQVKATHLKAPLEFVDLHFFIEGVTRAFTHQMVRQRTAVYAQESLRFAVKENMAQEVARPPSLSDPNRSVSARNDLEDTWDRAIDAVNHAYHSLIANGVPAEDARGLLPHAVTTRLHYKTNLRNLLEHAGNRLCTQAQFEWRAVFLEIIAAIRNYKALGSYSWQFRHIADDTVFAPVCYELGRCPFQADFDRGCTIRERVEMLGANGVPSDQWHESNPSIRREEWLENPKAGWVK
jgi:flavin-dependent thymidylate synthase